VIPIPGASAFLAALVASGLPTDSFRFSGFLPSKSGQRRKLLESVKASPRTQVFYDAPHRLLETLADVVEVLGEGRHVVVAREVTKIHEEFLRGRAGDLLQQFKSRGNVKGEITLLIAKAEDGAVQPASETLNLSKRVREIMAEDKSDEKAALKKVAKERGIGKSEAYREWQQSKSAF
jgi:16S rRNA (cytidine1402-2'-O)-methyltransferase